MSEMINLLKNADLSEPIHNVKPDTYVMISGHMQAVEVSLSPAESKKNPNLRRFRILEYNHIMYKLDSQLSCVQTNVKPKIYAFLLANKYITIKRFGATVGLSMSSTKEVLRILLEMNVIQQYGTYYKRQDEWYDYIHCFIDPNRNFDDQS